MTKDTGSGLDISCDNRYLATGEEGKVAVVDCQNLPQTRTFLGHTDYVTAVAFSPDGVYLASSSWDQTIRIWQVSTGQEVNRFNAPEGCPRALGYSPDGKTLWVGTTAGVLYQLDLEKNLVNKIGQSDLEITQVAATSTVVFGGNKEGKLFTWDVATGVLLSTAQAHAAEIHSMLLASDKTLLFTGGMDKLMKIWDVATGKEVMPATGHVDEVVALTVAADAAELLTGSVDCTARLWNLETGKQLMKFKGANEMGAVAFAPHAKKIAISDFDTIFIHHRQNGSLLFTLKGHSNKVRWLYFSSNGTSLYSAGWDGLICCWNISDGTLVWKADVGDSIECADMDEQRDQIVIGTWMGLVQLWNSSTGTKIKDLPKHFISVYNVQFLPDRQVISGSEGGYMHIVKTSDDQTIEFTIPNLKQFKVLSDGITLAVITEGKLELWSWPTASLVTSIVQPNQAKTIATTPIFPLKFWIGNSNGVVVEYCLKP